MTALDMAEITNAWWNVKLKMCGSGSPAMKASRLAKLAASQTGPMMASTVESP